MTKRDDDSQADMEVGMTTAERRRRRRRGGLRVPSDNVPRRTSTPPVAPVPEDPALAMSIAYSFTTESSEPIARPRDSVPGFESHEGMPTVIDPPSGPVEQADFEMKTREMTAVDLDELGLSEFAPGGVAMGRTTLRDMEPIAIPPSGDGEAVGGQRELTDPDAVEVDLDASGVEMDGVVDAGMTLDQETGDGRARRAPDVDADIELDSAEPTAIHPGPPAPPTELPARAEPPPLPRSSQVMLAVPAVPVIPVPMASEASGPRPMAPVSHEGSGPRPAPIAPGAGEAPYPRPVGHEASGPRPAVGSIPIPPVTAPTGGLRVGRAQTFALTEDDLEEVREQAARLANQPATPAPGPTHPPPATLSSLSSGASGPPSYPSLPPPQPPSRPASTSIPPPMPPAKPTKPRITAPMVVPVVPAIEARPAEGKAAEAPTEFEVDVDGIVDAKPVAALDPAGGSAPRPAGGAVGGPTPRLAALDPTGGAAPRPAGGAVGGPAPRLAALDPTGGAAPRPAGGAVGGPTPRLAALEVNPDEPVPAVPPATLSSVAPLSPIAPLSSVAPLSSQPSAQPPTPPPAHPPAPPRDSQPMGAPREGGHSQPPPPPKAPPSPPPAAVKKDRPTAAAAPLAKPETRPETRDVKDVKADGKPRGKQWFVDLFDEDYLRTLPFLTPQATQAEAEFVINALGLQPGAQVLDVGCGYGRHAMELAARGFHIVGLDLSTPLLVRGGEEAHRRGLTIHFLREDMREIDFDGQFDGAYCLFSTFGYFEDETNKKTVANMARALRPGGRLLIEILNRDYVIADLPTRVWWEGEGCVVLEEVELNYFSSRIQVNRSVVFDDGRQLEQEISVRAYSLHEVGKLMHSAGLRVLEVSGAYHTRGRFFGNQSRHIIVLAERKDPAAG